MTPEYHKLLGEPISPEQLVVSKARELAQILREPSRPFVTFIECLTNEHFEIVVFEVEVELGQKTAYPIERDERLAALFARTDRTAPEVWALRKNFPEVPHLNISHFDFPKSLCLYEEPYRDIKRRWTAARFVERIREWLALTAKGTLHQDDQPLEPLLFGHSGTIVLPASLQQLEQTSSPRRLFISALETEENRYFLLTHEDEKQGRGGLRAVASVHLCPPRAHGLIRWCPRHLRDLAEFVSAAGTDLLSEVQGCLRQWQNDSGKSPNLLDSHLVLVILAPKSRAEGGTAESSDTWAFISDEPLRDIGEKLGVWELNDGQVGLLIGDSSQPRAEEVSIALLNPSFRLSRESAARLNGRRDSGPTQAVAVGVGALGSQVVMNLARSGFGSWTLIDDDRLMPHNLARHVLDGHHVGFHKSEVLAYKANSLLDAPDCFEAIPADVIEPREHEDKVTAALCSAQIILDMSASVSVSRSLALREDTSARRVSLFLNPTGDDLVLLAEDDRRATRLDSLEMQYYRALLTDEGLEGHFQPTARRRYGQSCRDITSDLPQDLVALHAATASRAIKAVAATPGARITIWRAGRDGSVRRFDIGVAPEIRHTHGEWTVCTDALLQHRLAELREKKLPNETGGILLGSFDLKQKTVYVVDTIPSPPDSEEWPTLYIRGCHGLEKQVNQVTAKTDGMLEYIGEWHSHPRGCSTSPSEEDREGFTQLAKLMIADGLPAMIMIVGDGGHSSCYIGAM